MIEEEERKQYDNVSAHTLVFDLNREILTRWNEAINHVQKHHALELTGSRTNPRSLVECVYGLFLMIRSSLRRDLKKTENNRMTYDDMVDTFKTQNYTAERVIEVFEEIDQWLYDKKLTQVDTKKRYDRARVEIANKMKGL